MKIPLARYWALLASYLKDQTGLFALLSMLLVSSIGFKILIPQVTRAFIDSAMAGDEVDQLLLLAAAFIGIAIFQQLLAVGATWSGEVVAWNATNQLRIDVAEHTLHLDMAFHKSKTPGEMIERLDEDVTALARFFSQLVVIVGGNLLLMAGVLVMFFMEHFWLGMAYTIFSFGSLYLLNRLREFAIPFEIKRRQAIADLLGYLEERLSGTEDVRSSGAVDYIINGLYRLQSNLFHHWKNVQFRYWLLGVISRLITVLGYALAFTSGFYLFNSGAIGISTAFLIIHYMNLLARPLQQLSSQVEGLQGVGASIERISELMVAQRSIEDGTRSELPDGPLQLQFDAVSFGYDAEETVLEKITLDLQAGKVLGVLGRTGSGKTTLTRLIFRLYDPDQGTIRIGGREIRQLKVADLRHRVGLVTQDVQLFQASVRDNLTFFASHIPDQKILQVLQQLELWDWYSRLPNGLDTRLETGGRSMSAGEAQLLAFTRVFLQDPGLVVLDEASSRLDPATEARIERAMDTLLANRTAIVIAHRLGTVDRADEVMILDSGAIIELGERSALANDHDSHFSELLRVGLENVLV